MNLNKLWGINEAGKAWNLSPAYVKNICKEGKVKAVKIGKTWIIDSQQPNPASRKKIDDNTKANNYNGE